MTETQENKAGKSLKWRIAEFLYWDDGKCDWCGEELGEDGVEFTLRRGLGITLLGRTITIREPYPQLFMVCAEDCLSESLTKLSSKVDSNKND